MRGRELPGKGRREAEEEQKRKTVQVTVSVGTEYGEGSRLRSFFGRIYTGDTCPVKC